MSDSRTQFENIYSDTNYFINAIVSDYGFYGDFINSVRAGGTEIEVKRKKLRKTVEAGWVEAIEDSLAALDAAVRHPGRDIVEREEVMPIELSRNIGNRSIRHLAQHTDYINKIEGDVITPSKILNVFREESLLTYENKFVNTLIQRLFMFINKRYSQLKADGFSSTNVAMGFNSDFVFGKSKGKIHIDMEVSDDSVSEEQKEESALMARVEKLYSVAMMYMNSEFVKNMGQNYVRPPIIRTNAITKNKDLKQCLVLWEFIETYDKVGYTIDVSETAEKPDEEYINSLYSMLALEYVMFRYNLQNGAELHSEVVLEKSTPRPLAPKFNTQVKDIEAEDYNVYDSEYRRVVPVSQLSASKHRLSAGEQKIKEAIDTALAADKVLADRRRAEAKAAEQRRIEQEKAEADRLAAEAAEQAAREAKEKARLEAEAKAERERARTRARVELKKMREKKFSEKLAESKRRLEAIKAEIAENAKIASGALSTSESLSDMKKPFDGTLDAIRMIACDERTEREKLMALIGKGAALRNDALQALSDAAIRKKMKLRRAEKAVIVPNNAAKPEKSSNPNENSECDKAELSGNAEQDKRENVIPVLSDEQEQWIAKMMQSTEKDN